MARRGRVQSAAWVGAAVIGLAAVAATAAEKPAAGTARKDPPATAPASKSAMDIKARRQFLEQQKLAGRVALIEFGAYDCALSGEGLDRMAELQAKDSIPGLAYARVEVGKDAAAVEAYYKAKPLKFPVYRDADGSVARAFDATMIPTFILADKFGNVRYRGKYPDRRLREWVMLLSVEKADPGPNVALFGTVALDAARLLEQTKLPVLGGDAKALGEFMGEAGLMLLFVDTTCPFSAQAMKDLPKVASTLKTHKVSTLLVNLDDAEAKVKARFAGRDMGAPVTYDVTTATKNAWGIQAVPAVVYVAPDKQVGYSGKALWADLAAAIEKARGLKPGTITFEARGTGVG